MKSAGLAQLPSDFGVMDYLTTQQDDYRNPNPSVAKPVNCFIALKKLIYSFYNGLNIIKSRN